MGDLFIQNVLFFLCQIFWGIAEVDHCHLCRGDDLPVFFWIQSFFGPDCQLESMLNGRSDQITSEHLQSQP